MTPARRSEAHRSYGRATARAFEAVAWRAPTAARFDDHVANDAPPVQPTVGEVVRDLPAWLHVVGGGIVAAGLGAMLGGFLHI